MDYDFAFDLKALQIKNQSPWREDLQMKVIDCTPFLPSAQVANFN
jgi:hypothetical protein